MSYKKNLMKELTEDKQYKALLKSVPDDQKKLFAAQVEAFIDAFSGDLLDALSEIIESPEGNEEFIKELNKTKASST